MKRIALVLSMLILGLGVSGMSQFFSTDPRLDWWTIETDHFYIIFHTGLEDMAQEAAALAESAYENWESWLDYHVENKTKIVLVDNSDIDGGAADPTSQVIAITPTEARTLNEWLNSRNKNPLDNVVTHEHGHIVDLMKVSGLSAELRKAFGSSIIPTLFKPAAFIEGIPIYFEMLRGGESRANDPRNQMYFREMVVEDNFLPFSQILNVHERNEWPSLYMISHDIGPWIVRYMGETYGRESIERFDRALAEDPLALTPFLSQVVGDMFGVPLPPVTPDFGALTQESIGVSGEEFAQGFEQWLKDMFSGQIESIRSEGVTETQRLSNLDYWNNKPVWSPDGQWIAYFHSDRDRGSQLRLMHPDGSDDHAIAAVEPGLSFFRPHFWSPRPSWAPDSQSILYSDINLDDLYYLRSDIYQYNIATGTKERLTWGERAYHPAFTPDGKQIIYARFEEGAKVPNLYIYDLETQKKRVLYRLPEDALLDSFSIGPSGNILALALWRWGGYQDIYVLPMSGGDLVPITKDKASDYDPIWSPDGEMLIFSSDRSGVNNLFTYSFNNGQFTRITNMLSGAFHPAISPEADEIAFVSYVTSGYQLEKMSFDPTQGVVIPKPKREEYPGKKKVQFEYPIKPFDRQIGLKPSGWSPVLGPGEVGINLTQSGPLFQEYYSVDLGLDYEHSQAYYALYYRSNSHIPPFDWHINLYGNSQGSHQAVGLTYPVRQTLTTFASLTLELNRSYFDQIHNGFSLSWDVGHLSGLDLFQNRLSLHTAASLTNVWDTKLWAQFLTLELNDEIRLPFEGDQRLSYTLGLGWSSGEPYEFALGGLYGPLAIRGVAPASISGDEYLIGRVEYQSELVSIRESFGTFPFFLDNLKGRVYADLGTAAETVNFDLNEWKAGFGAELQLSFTLAYNFDTGFRAGIAMDADLIEPQFYFDFGSAF